MVRVELNYNPYLLETEVRFNGNPPRINSLVEKYQKEKLQIWIDLIPSIFRDEMNGYGFELLFSGTERDFAELTNAFSRAGVGKEQVPMFHKGELKSRYEKSKAIDELLNWLRKNPDRLFDYSSFAEINRNLFEGAYAMVVVGGENSTKSEFMDFEVEVENVKTIDEVKNTDLTCTPIVMYVTSESLHTLRSDLHELLSRADITQNQVFFIIDPKLSESIVRVIQDLGFHDPQVVASVNDDCVHRYLELFPVSEYIHEAIMVLKSKAEELKESVEAFNRESAETNQEVYNKIQETDEIINRLKISSDLFSNRDNLELPEEIIKEKQVLIKGINSWRSKRTKVTKVEEAVMASRDFEAEIKRLFRTFENGIFKICDAKRTDIFTTCDAWYKKAELEDAFSIDEKTMSVMPHRVLPDIADELLEIKDEQLVEQKPKEDFFGIFFKVAIDTPKEKILETTYYYEKWRTYAAQIIEPIADQMIQETYDSLKGYYNRLLQAYSSHLNKQIRVNTNEKQRVSAQLSEDERMQQYDNDWVTTFCDKLRDIERL